MTTSRPPLVCAGLRRFIGYAQASTVAIKLGQTPRWCDACRAWHIGGYRQPIKRDHL